MLVEVLQGVAVGLLEVRALQPWPDVLVGRPTFVVGRKGERWVMVLETDEGELRRVLRFMAPDCSSWEWGCERDDWTLGPDSVVVDPLGMIEADTAAALVEALRCAPVAKQTAWAPLGGANAAPKRDWHKKGRRKTAAR